MSHFLQYVVFGLTTGGFLLLATVGFSLVRRIDGFLNIGHAQFIAFGAYMTWALNAQVGMSIVLSAAIAVVATAMFALIVSWIFYQPIQAYGPVTLLIASVGITFAIQGAIEIFVPKGTSVFDIPSKKAVHLGGIRVDPYQAIVLAMALATVLILYVLFTRTSMGRRIRAVSVDRELAQSRGISVRKTSRTVWLMSGATAGLAGVALGLTGTLTTDIAFQQFLLIFAVAIFAGFGSLLNLLAAALLIGLAMDISLLWIPGAYNAVIPFVIMIVVLLFRPQGLGNEASV